jgi:hypothetical protein
MFQLPQCLAFGLIILLPNAIFALDSGRSAKPPVEETRVDLMELNHRYDDQGRHCYDQIIFYEWSPDYRRYHVVAWRLLDSTQSKMPSFSHTRNRYEVGMYNRDLIQFHQIWSPMFRETWSTSDPERANKELLDEKYRVALLRSPQPRQTIR